MTTKKVIHRPGSDGKAQQSRPVHYVPMDHPEMLPLLVIIQPNAVTAEDTGLSLLRDTTLQKTNTACASG